MSSLAGHRLAEEGGAALVYPNVDTYRRSSFQSGLRMVWIELLARGATAPQRPAVSSASGWTELLTFWTWSGSGCLSVVLLAKSILSRAGGWWR